MLEHFDIPHPHLPGPLDGLRIAHLSDTHARRRRPGSPWRRQILDALTQASADLLALTGDWMDQPGHEDAAIDLLAAVAEAAACPLGTFGVLGNHDTFELATRLRAEEAPPITWLDQGSVDVPERPGLRLLGLSWPEDPIAGVLAPNPSPDAFTIALCHMPTPAIPLAEFGIPLILCGHTHGGQIRLSPGRIPHRSGDVASEGASGAARIGDSLCCVSRGVGEAVASKLRFNCPRQVACYTLRRAPLPDALPATDRKRGMIGQVISW